MVTSIQGISAPVPSGSPTSNDRDQQVPFPETSGSDVQVFSPDQMKSVVAELNKIMESVTNDLEFSVDSSTNETVIKVVNTTTGQVVRQIPSEEMLRVAQRIVALLGVLYDHEG